MREPKIDSQDFKDKVVKEFEETGSLTAVAKNHSIPLTTLPPVGHQKNAKENT